MKFVLFSPFAKASAIGRVTALLVQACAPLGHSITIVRTEQESLLDTPAHACDAPVIPWTDAAAVGAAIKAADAVVYQIGNNYSYHRGGLSWLGIAPGIVCLHDFLVAHMFVEWAAGRDAEAREVLHEWYGASAPTEFFAMKDPDAFVEMASQRYPMTEWVAAMALGVISHSQWGMPRVAQSCPGPLRVVPLPYDAPACKPAAPVAPDPQAPVHILTVGHMNANKRVESVIRAIGTSTTLRERVSYRLCGRVEPPTERALKSLAESLGVTLVVSGETDDAALQEAMNHADVVCCLRWPSFEAASATAIEGLLYGKAVVVTDTAFYSELPSDCVQKISPDNELSELRTALELLCNDADARNALAARGQAWATRTFNPTNYMEQLADFARRTCAAEPLIGMVGAMTRDLSAWQASREIFGDEYLTQPLQLFQIDN